MQFLHTETPSRLSIHDGTESDDAGIEEQVTSGEQSRQPEARSDCHVSPWDHGASLSIEDSRRQVGKS